LSMQFGMTKVRIEKFKAGQETMIYELIKKVYDEFVSLDYSEDGNQFFYDWIQPSRILERQQKHRTILTAIVDSIIVGMIEIRDNNTISLLFVDKAYQGQAIAKKLFQKSLKECFKKDKKLDKFYVHASPFSIPVYNKLGFTGTDVMQENNGIKYLPMEMEIKK
jgi:predicted GNAT family N-acyltransferase